MNFYLKQMEELGADGIDFVPIGFSNEFSRIIKSYTKEEFKAVTIYPRSSYKFWKLINGVKTYIPNVSQQMTEEQMRQRMKEIDAERNKLRTEKEEYENYFSNKKRQEELENHQNFVGKCYLIRNSLQGINEYKYIKSFKILQILDEPNGNYAICMALIDGYRSTCFHEYGIQLMTLPLWTPNTRKLMSHESDPKVIDLYHEIERENFNNLYKSYKGNIDNYATLKEKIDNDF